MRDRALLLMISLLLIHSCSAELALEIAKTLDILGNPLKIRRDYLGAIYIRGFPKGAWGTHLFPAMSIMKGKEGEDATNPAIWSILEHVQLTSSAIGDYHLYIKRLRSKFCDGWSCCEKKTKVACSNPPITARQMMEYILDPIQTLPLSFAFRWCAQAWNEYWKLKDEGKREQLLLEIEQYCPDPCHGNPCRNVKNVNVSTFCQVTGSFENEYTCDCKNNSVWDPNLLTCQRVSPCYNEEFSPCMKEHTDLCVAKDEETAVCICKPEFMGKDCSLLRDACQERVNKSQPNGYTLCQVHFGNECHPVFGTDAYTCVCRYGYAPSFKISEDNCLTRLDPCRNSLLGDEINETSFYENPFAMPVLVSEAIDEYNITQDSDSVTAKIIQRGITCLNGGYCVSSADFTRATCLCPSSGEGEPLYRGLNCEIPVGVWSAWSHMTPCLPSDCGRTRYRWRRRRCLNLTSSEQLINSGKISRGNFSKIPTNFTPAIHCVGTSEEVIPCESLQSCVIVRLPGYLREEILNYDTLYYFGYITAAQVIISLLSWYVFIIPVKKFLIRKKLRRGAAIIA